MKNENSVKTTSKKALHRFAALAAVLFAVCLVFMTPVSAADSVFSGGSGTENDPYKISTADGLKQLAEDVNGGNTYFGKYFQLTQDIALSSDWTYIGCYDKPFQGTFDGNNHTISGLVMKGSADNPKVGLFNYIGGFGHITNLAVEGKIDVTHSNDFDNKDNGLYVGGIAGWNLGTIQNCYFIGSVKVTSSKSSIAAYAGGIAGHNAGAGIIKNCYSAGEVNAVANSNTNSFAGGIIGMNSGTIQNCYSTCTVSTSGKGASGGIIGMNSGTMVQNCYALNNAISSTYLASRIAGLSFSMSGSSITLIPLTDKNNFGWKHMTLNPATPPAEPADAAQMVVSGTDACAGDIQYDTNWDSSIWDMDGEGNYLLPVLKGFTTHPTETPAHLTKITVTFNADGGTTAPEQQTILEGAKVTKPTGVTKTGHTLDGWYEESTYTTGWEFDTKVCAESPTTMTLYAKWKPVQYTVKFSNTTATGSMDDQSFSYTDSKALSANTFTVPTGKKFGGWATTENGDPVYQDKATVTGAMLSAHANENNEVTLYACWIDENVEQPTYTVTFNSNGGTTVSSQTVFSGGKASKPDVTRTGYTLEYWYKEGETTAWDFNTDVTENIVLNAKWTAKQYTITFNTDGGSAVSPITKDYGESVTAPASPTKTGHTFAGWDKQIPTTMPAEDMTITAKWTAKQYTIIFDTKGGSDIPSITLGYGSAVAAPANPTKTGYDFAGWDKEIPATMPAEDMTITAQWTPITYHVKFFYNGGSGTMADQKFTYDEEQALTPNAFTPPEGKIFGGWQTSSSGAPVYADGEVVKNLYSNSMSYIRTVSLYANWTDRLCYTVIFDANGGTGTMENQEFEYGVTEVLNASTFTAPSGKVFNGWNTKADGSGTYYPAGYSESKIPCLNNAEITLYAQWKAKSSGGSHSTTKTTYTVTFNANGGAGEMFQQTFTSGKEKALNLNFFTREGYTFAGWATSADGAVVYTDGETIKVSKSMTLYAVWESDEPVNPDQPGDEPGQPGDEPDKPEEPTEPETPAPILAVLAGLGAAVVLRRK